MSVCMRMSKQKCVRGRGEERRGVKRKERKKRRTRDREMHVHD